MGESVMQEAQRIIHGDRNESYGPYERESERIAKGWSLLLGHEVDPKKVPLMMIWLKVSREIHSHKRDNLVDICGYAGLLDELFENPQPVVAQMPCRRAQPSDTTPRSHQLSA